MKKIFSFLCIVLVMASSYQCNNKTGSGKEGVLKGRLVIKEICSHYVVQVVEGQIADSLVTNGWTDDKRGKTYDKVFTISNRCSFPAASIKEGDEFEFTIDANPVPEDCAVCMAFYPTPEKRNAIKIIPAKK
jgi:hypothetical protein